MGTRFQKQRDEIQKMRDGELASAVDLVELFDLLDAEFDRLDAAIEHVREELYRMIRGSED